MEKTRLDQVAKVEISGVDKKTKPGQQIVRLCNFTDVYYNWAITQDLHDSFMVASANQKEIDSLSLHKGQVALTKDSETRDDIGISTYIADDFDDVVLGYHTALITPDETKLNGKYLNAFLHTPYMQKYFAFNASGSGQRYTLSTEALNAIQLILPSLEEQERIGNLFSLLDRKISLNRSINKELEEMAKEIYDYWFVQFDFPDANGLPYKSSGGTMVYNPILKRDIPEEWDVKRIDEILEIKSGFPFKSDSYLDSGKFGIITIKNVQDGYLDVSNVDYINDIPSRLPEYCKLKIGDQLISLTGNVGRTCSVYQDNLLLNQRAGVITPIINNKEWIRKLFDSSYIKKQILSLANGCAQANVSPIDIGKIYIPTPNDVLLCEFDEKVTPITDSLISNYQEINHLCLLRNELLPLLMTGQVKII